MEGGDPSSPASGAPPPAAAADADASTAVATVNGCADAQVDGSVTAHELNLRDPALRPLVGLELPVYAADPAKMLPLVGGLATLQRTHESKSQFLSVKMRPGEPSCKPLFADLTKTQMLLLRVRRKRPKTMTTSQAEAPSSNDNGGVQAEIVGLVREKYVCEGMADFQYLTARRFFPGDSASESDRRVDLPPAVDTSGHVWPPSENQRTLKASLRPYLKVAGEEELEMVPEVFSKVDLPLKYEFRQRSGYQPAETAKKSTTTMTYLNFHDEAPAPEAPPSHPAAQRSRSVGASDGVSERVTRLLRAKLEEKPVWLRTRMFAGFDAAEKRAARRIIRQFCYVFIDGPWRGSWIRMGYDPRSTPESAKYQVVELRNNRELVHSKVTHPNRKRTKKFGGAKPKGPRIAKVTQTSANESVQASKRRRKERFTRGETRRSFLVDPDEPSTGSASGLLSPLPSPGHSVDARERDESEHSDNTGSEDEVERLEDAMDTVSVSTSAAVDRQSTPPSTAEGTSGQTFEIFGVELTSANVLFQMDEIDDDDVRAWVAQFAVQDQPTLFGGWYSTHMFMPLRELIRCRIAALVGRSKAELESRRTQVEALKKQALSDYADERAGGGKTREDPKEKKMKAAAKSRATADDATEQVEDQATKEQEAEELAFEQSLTRHHVTRSLAKKLAVGEATGEGSGDVDRVESGGEDEAMEVEDEAEEKEDANEETKAARSQRHPDEVDDEDDEYEDEDEEGVNEVNHREVPSPNASEASTDFSGSELTGAAAEGDAEDAAEATATEYAF